MTRTCPICGSEAEEIDQGTFDGTAFRCKTHGEVEVTYDALFENRGASPEQLERAFQVAWTRAAAAGGRPRIFTLDRKRLIGSDVRSTLRCWACFRFGEIGKPLSMAIRDGPP